jgi:hypothetical protein
MASKEVLAAMTAINALGTLADLKVVNATLKERWNAIQRQSAAVVAVTIGTGARVKFVGRGRMVFGTVEKFGAKNAKVLADDGMRWTVAAHLLTLLTVEEERKVKSDTVSRALRIVEQESNALGVVSR